jgi:GT2 family glycosyltransferase
MEALRIVIVNTGTGQLVVDCLRSLAADVRAVRNCNVVIVDHPSQDGSVEQIERAARTEGWQDWVRVLSLPTNRGFAAGNNAALGDLRGHGPGPDYVLLLNPDTVVRPGAVQALYAFMESHPEVGIAGSRLENPDGTPQRSAFRFPSITSEVERGMRLGIVSRLLRRWLVAPPVRAEAHPTDWVCGASMIVRRAVFQAIGLLDEGYFLYFEEVDFCLRARRAGWSCWYVPSSRVVHLIGQTTGFTASGWPVRRVPIYWFASRQRYFSHNHGRSYALLANAAWAVSFASWRVRRRLQRKPDLDPPGVLWDFLRFGFRHRDQALTRIPDRHLPADPARRAERLGKP